MRYTGFFKSLEGFDYKVEVIPENGGTLEKELPMSGIEPARIEFKDANTRYEPIRGSVCTVRFLADNYPMDIFSGKANGTEVVISRRDPASGAYYEPVWTGYLQPCLYSQGYSDPIEELELQASDYLTVLQYFDYKPYYNNKLSIVSFKDILVNIVEMFDRISGFAVADLGTDESGNRIRLDNLFISEGNFFSSEGEPWKLREVLEEICKYLNLSAVVEKDRIVLVDYGNLAPGNYADYYPKSNGYKPFKEAFCFSVIINKDTYRQTGADMSLDEVYNKITVKANQYNVKNMLPDISDKKQMENLGGEDKIVKYNAVTHVVRGQPVSVGTAYYRIYDHKGWKQNAYTRADYQIDTPLEKVELTKEQRATPETYKNYIMPSLQDFAFIGKDDKYGKIKFDTYLCLCQKNSPNCWVPSSTGQVMFQEGHYVPLFETEHITPMIYGDDAYLIINFKALKNFFVKQPWIYGTAGENQKKIENKSGGKWYAGMELNYVGYEQEITFQLRVNNQWWNGKTWQPQRCEFFVKCDPLADNSYFYTSNGVPRTIPTELFVEDDGYMVKLPKNYSTADGIYLAVCQPKPTVAIKGVLTSDVYGECGNAYTWLSGLTMKVEKKGTILWEDKDIVYENVIDEKNVKEAPSINLRITTENKKSFSLSTVGILDQNGKVIPLTKVKKPNFNVARIEEENIVAAYVSQYSTPSIKENVTVSNHGNSFSLVTDEYWGSQRKFFVTGRSIDLAMDRQTLHLTEYKDIK